MTGAAWVRRLFIALAVLHVFPVWSVRYLPTTDGPCHTYNSWVLQQLWSGEASPLIREHYEVNARPYPNWAGQAVLAGLMFAVPPLAAEKVLASGALLLFLGGAWALAGAVRPGERWPAFLAFPFAYNLFFQYGFYNFCLSLGVYLAALAVWWKHRERPGPGLAVKINLLLLLCYFCHIVSLILALLSIAVLWLATLRRESWRRHLLHIPILLPQLILPLWFIGSQPPGVLPPSRSLGELVAFLIPPRILQTFGPFQFWLAVAVAAAFLVLAVLTLRRRRPLRPVPEDGFLLLTIVLAVVYLASPEGMSGGSVLTSRLSLYPWLVLIPWLAPGQGPRGRTAGAAVLTVLAVAGLAYVFPWYGRLDREMGRYLAGLSGVRPDSRLLPLFFRRDSPAQGLDLLSHAAGYAAVEKGLIDWDNYQAKVPFFPVRFRSSVRQPALAGILTDPGTLRVRENRNRIDAIYVRGMPEGHPLARRLRKHYRLVAETEGGDLWQRRPTAPAAPPGGSARPFPRRPG